MARDADICNAGCTATTVPLVPPYYTYVLSLCEPVLSDLGLISESCSSLSCWPRNLVMYPFLSFPHQRQINIPPNHPNGPAWLCSFVSGRPFGALVTASARAIVGQHVRWACIQQFLSPF